MAIHFDTNRKLPGIKKRARERVEINLQDKVFLLQEMKLVLLAPLQMATNLHQRTRIRPTARERIRGVFIVC
jgi:hypothetical protein